MLDLADEIHDRRYRPGKSRIFVVLKPKPREIIAANVRDRVVHHFLYMHLEPYYEARFVKNSHACRAGKGPVHAVKDLQRFLRNFRRKTAQPLYYLKLDVQSFFPSINRRILWRMLLNKVKNPLLVYLIKENLTHRPTDPGNYELRSPAALLELIPPYKSLFKVARHLGLAIGNLTSQFFANVYMNEFDQFMKHELQGGWVYWSRYVDDILILADDPAKLREMAAKISRFLDKRLELVLNPKKTLLQPMQHGVDFLGYFVGFNFCYVRPKNVENVKRILAGPQGIGVEDLPRLNSALGFFRHADSFRLRQKIAARAILVARVPMVTDADVRSIRALPAEDAVPKMNELARKQAFKEDYLAAGGHPALCRKYLRSWVARAPLADA